MHELYEWAKKYWADQLIGSWGPTVSVVSISPLGVRLPSTHLEAGCTLTLNIEAGDIHHIEGMVIRDITPGEMAWYDPDRRQWDIEPPGLNRGESEPSPPGQTWRDRRALF